jgi:two-component system CheB/CheR fusion protein
VAVSGSTSQIRSRRHEAVDRANNDLQNLFDSTAVATVFLDSNLVIRTFTPAMAEVLNIRPSDRGRPITDLARPLRLEGLDRDIAQVVATNAVFEQRIESEDCKRHYLVRLAPYRNGDRKVDGVVITFMNVTRLTQAESRQRC